MSVKDLRRLLDWCDAAEDNAGFWRRMYYAAFALNLRTRLLIQALVAEHGILPNQSLNPAS